MISNEKQQKEISFTEGVKWDQVVDSFNVLPEHERDAHKLIIKMLGFLPESNITLPEEPFLRKIIANIYNDTITSQQCFGQADPYIISIRNKWLHPHHTSIKYHEQIYETYSKITSAHKQKIRERLTKTLGYEPDLETSIAAEIKLIDTFFGKEKISLDEITPADPQAILIIKYREILLSDGKIAADKSPLPATEIEYFVDNGSLIDSVMTEDERRRLRMKKYIDKFYNGDEKAYQKAKELEETVGWDQIVDSVNILPNLELRAHKLIKVMLGFLPEPNITIPEEPFLRGLITSSDSGLITSEQFYTQAEQCIIPMRNKWLLAQHTDIKYSDRAHKVYSEILPEHKHKVRERLSRFLGYEPNIETSIYVEIKLIGKIFDDLNNWPEEITPAELQAIMIIKYREILLSEGKDAADKSPLPIPEIEYLANKLHSVEN